MPEAKKTKPSAYKRKWDTNAPLLIGGREYRSAPYLQKKYGITPDQMTRYRREQGLPYLKVNGARIYICERDLNAWFAGEIGKKPYARATGREKKHESTVRFQTI